MERAGRWALPTRLSYRRPEFRHRPFGRPYVGKKAEWTARQYSTYRCHAIGDACRHADVLDFREIGEGIVAVQAAETALPVATRFRFGKELVVIVDPHRAVAQRARDAKRARAVVGPHARREAKYGVVSSVDCLRFSVERFQRDERPEDFLLAEERFRVAVFDERRREKRVS
jgi:hypothetical protein